MPRVPEKARLIQQVPFRLHIDDHKVMRQLLEDDGLSWQTFVSACVDAYVRGDPHILKVVKNWKELNTIPKEVRDRYTLSQRDRDKLLAELEASEQLPSGKGET